MFRMKLQLSLFELVDIDNLVINLIQRYFFQFVGICRSYKSLYSFCLIILKAKQILQLLI